VDPPLKKWIFDQPDVVAIEYHTWFPYAGDPFYQATIPLVLDRLDRYDLRSAPNVRFDGPFTADPRTVAEYTALRAERLAEPSHTILTLSGSFVEGAGVLEVAIAVESVPEGNWRLLVAVTESEIYYEAPNGIDLHHHVMRDFATSVAGVPVDLAAGEGAPLMVEVPFTLDPSWNEGHVSLVAFLQEDDTDVVDQAAEVRVLDLPPVPVEVGSWSRLKEAFRR
jgi:hypothetical protein